MDQKRGDGAVIRKEKTQDNRAGREAIPASGESKNKVS